MLFVILFYFLSTLNAARNCYGKIVTLSTDYNKEILEIKSEKQNQIIMEKKVDSSKSENFKSKASINFNPPVKHI